MDYALISEVLVGPSFQELTCVDTCSLEQITMAMQDMKGMKANIKNKICMCKN